MHVEKKVLSSEHFKNYSHLYWMREEKFPYINHSPVQEYLDKNLQDQGIEMTEMKCTWSESCNN